MAGSHVTRGAVQWRGVGREAMTAFDEKRKHERVSVDISVY